MASLENDGHEPSSPEPLETSGADYQQLEEVEKFDQEYDETQPEDAYHKGTHAARLCYSKRDFAVVVGV